MSWLKNVFDLIKPGTRKLAATIFLCVLCWIVDIIQLFQGKPMTFDASVYQWVIGMFLGANVVRGLEISKAPTSESKDTK